MPNSLSIMAGEDSRKLDFSPLFIGLLGIIAGAIIVATYHCISISCCTQRHTTAISTNQRPPRQQSPQRNEELIEGENTAASSSSNSSTVQLIPVYKYGKGCKEGLCAVCLSEYNDGEEIRILPECAHSFHAACIDMWLYSHSNCPLCRADTTPSPPQPQPPPHVVVAIPPELHGVQNFEG